MGKGGAENRPRRAATAHDRSSGPWRSGHARICGVTAGTARRNRVRDRAASRAASAGPAARRDWPRAPTRSRRGPRGRPPACPPSAARRPGTRGRRSHRARPAPRRRRSAPPLRRSHGGPGRPRPVCASSAGERIPFAQARALISCKTGLLPAARRGSVRSVDSVSRSRSVLEAGRPWRPEGDGVDDPLWREQRRGFCRAAPAATGAGPACSARSAPPRPSPPSSAR